MAELPKKRFRYSRQNRALFLKNRIKKLIENREQLRKVFAIDGIHSSREKAMDPFMSEALNILEERFADEDFGAKELAHALHLSRMLKQQ